MAGTGEIKMDPNACFAASTGYGDSSKAVEAAFNNLELALDSFSDWKGDAANASVNLLGMAEAQGATMSGFFQSLGQKITSVQEQFSAADDYEAAKMK